MKAGWYEGNGSAHEVITVGEMETPSPAAGEVLVRVAMSGVNPSDVKSRAGRPLIAPRIVPHSDGAGTIEAVGEGVDAARIGERVWLWNGQWKRPFGTAAHFIALPAEQAVALPDRTDFSTGACLGIPALTAMHAVNRLGEVSGRTLLVTGAASAVGHYATQIAVRRGARVIGTASPARRDHALAAGAHDVIDYRKEDVAERVKGSTGGKGVDGIVDMDLSSTAALLSQGALAQYGRLVCYGSNAMEAVPVDFRAMLWGSLTLDVFVVYELRAEERQKAIADLHELLDDDLLIHSIGETFPLDRLADAHRCVEEGRTIGNVVVTMD